MYKLLNVEHLINDKNIWAHTSEVKRSETLEEHSKLCLKYYNKYCEIKGIENIVLNTIKACGCNDSEMYGIYNIFVNAIYLHDIGKINPYFQNKRLKNPSYKDIHDFKNANTNHSLPSAYIYMCEVMPFIEQLDRNSKKKFTIFMFSFAYNISKHHGYLKDAVNFKDDILNCSIEDYYNKKLNLDKNSILTINDGYTRLKKYISDEIAFYILNKLHFSLLVSCDYCATSEYINGREIEIETIKDIDDFSYGYYNSEIYQGIEKYKLNKEYFADDPINALRSDLFIEAQKNLEENLDGNIYYLEAPTGSGKTNNSINLAINIIKRNPSINNIFYIFPFNTLVEQTAEVLERYFKKDIDFAIVNSITPIVIKSDEEIDEPDYEYSYLDRIFNNYPVVVTSHVNFFNMLFGIGRDQVFPLTKLCNSVVVIDEIQSYKNDIWRHIIIFLSKYAQLLNIKIIIMSATLPKLGMMLEDENIRFVSLIKNSEKYFKDPLFKNRVELDFSLLQFGKISLEYLADKVSEYKDKKVLVEFIRKETAHDFYKIIKNIKNLNVVELTGDDNAIYRKEVIKKINDENTKSIIVIATQVIEAGIDIDMDIGFKDIAIPDSEEQFIGRINRSCKKKKCKAFFFDYDNPAMIYKDDIRVNFPITNIDIMAKFQDKNFESIYELIFKVLKVKSDRLNRDNIKCLFENCMLMNYRKISKIMTLIEGNAQVFLAHKIETGNGIIDGKDVWNEYKQLLKNNDMHYAEKAVNISRLKEKMSYFTYNVCGNIEIKCDEEFGGYYYINDGDRFIDDGKFDRKKFSSTMGGMFL